MHRSEQLAADLLMSVDGLKGEAGDHSVENALALTSWQFGMGRGIDGQGANRTISDASVTEMTVSCDIDQMVVGVAALCLAPKPVVKNVTIVQRRPGGGATAETFLVISLEGVIFTGMTQSGGGGGLPQCTISMNFTRATYNYFPQGSITGQSGPAFTWTWDAGAHS